MTHLKIGDMRNTACHRNRDRIARIDEAIAELEKAKELLCR